MDIIHHVYISYKYHIMCVYNICRIHICICLYIYIYLYSIYTFMIYKFILTFLLNKLVDVHPPSVIWGSGSSDWLPVERGWGDLTTGRGENMVIWVKYLTVLLSLVSVEIWWNDDIWRNMMNIWWFFWVIFRDCLKICEDCFWDTSSD